eukprot:4803431-Alexandrium_andersonii.AAC.1
MEGREWRWITEHEKPTSAWAHRHAEQASKSQARPRVASDGPCASGAHGPSVPAQPQDRQDRQGHNGP